MKVNLSFGSAPTVKCIYCGKDKGHHLAKTHFCPVGQKQRTMGYTQFSSTQRFSPKPLRMSEQKLIDANENTLRAFLRSHDVEPTSIIKSKLLKQALAVRAEYQARPIGY